MDSNIFIFALRDVLTEIAHLPYLKRGSVFVVPV